MALSLSLFFRKSAPLLCLPPLQEQAVHKITAIKLPPPSPFPFSKNSITKLVVLLSSNHCCHCFLQDPNPTASSPEDVEKLFSKAAEAEAVAVGFTADPIYSHPKMTFEHWVFFVS